MKILLRLRPDGGSQIPIDGTVFRLEGKWYRVAGEPQPAEEHGYFGHYSMGFELSPVALWIEAEELSAEDAQAETAWYERREQERLEEWEARPRGWRALFR